MYNTITKKITELTKGDSIINRAGGLGLQVISNNTQSGGGIYVYDFINRIFYYDKSLQKYAKRGATVKVVAR